ncbi:MAG: hypothetical protein KAR73_04315 [Spirochaetales bacterium]|nr:hypothetical protein [Spirochaetales bacterium]
MTSQELDQYGGWKKVKHQGTGFFRLEKIDDRWWFIDPEGHPFLSLGINHIKVSVLQEDYNRHVFTEKYGNAAEFYKHVFHDLKDWGFNTLGNYNDEEIPQKIPFVHLFRFLNISGYLASWKFREEFSPLPYEYFPDIFSESWREECEKKVAAVYLEFRDNPFLIGYFFSDVPVWTQGDRWIDAILRMDPATPGQKVYSELMERRYAGNISSWNAAYGTAYSGFEEILSRPFDRLPIRDEKRVREDDETFMRVLAREYYKYIAHLIRRYDSYHLLLGDCYDGNPGIPDFVLQEARPYVDALSLQYYQFDPFEEHFKRIDYWYRIIEKPVIATDSCYAVPKPKMPDPYGPHVSGHRERGLSYRRYVEALFGRPYGIGWLWCGYIDWLQGSGPPGKQVVHQHSGLKDEYDEPYTEVTDILTETNRQVYQIAAGATY